MPEREDRAPSLSREETRDMTPRQIERALKRKRERIDRRTDARVAKAIDPDVCCIPGCRTPLWHPTPRVGIPNPKGPGVDERLPLCARHLTIIGKQANVVWFDPDILEARAKYADHFVQKQIARDREWELQRENGGVEGQIYFIRQNGLVKVGWSSKLASRFKQYGANVEILCHFPGTRKDETNLHRQLRPYLARGREWYEDCPLIHDVVAGYVKQYGEPTIKADWTKPKPPTIKLRRTG